MPPLFLVTLDVKPKVYPLETFVTIKLESRILVSDFSVTRMHVATCLMWRGEGSHMVRELNLSHSLIVVLPAVSAPCFFTVPTEVGEATQLR